jgi:hypothetical protein
MRTLLFLLVASLAANGWLVFRRAAEPAENIPVRPGSGASPVASTQPGNLARQNDELVQILARAGEQDLDALVKSLRSAGADENAVRGVVDGVTRRKYRTAVAAWRSERWRTAWWKSGANSGAGMPAQRTLVTEPQKKLLGNDPLDLEDVAARYDFLSPEKRRLLAMIDLDYADLQKGPGGIFSRATTKAEAAEEQLLAQERRKDLLAALTPEERAEFELRFGGTATSNASRFATMNATEAEFRAVKPLLDAQHEAYRTSAQSSDRAAAVNSEQRTVDQIVAAIGYERAVDFLWGVAGPYDQVAQMMRETGRPVGNAAQVFQLAADVGEKAVAIHYDSSLSADQKRAALAVLQQSVRPQLDRLVAPADQARLPDAAITWFRALGEGRYEQPRPALSGSGRFLASPVAVSTPVKGPPPVVPIAKPPKQ